MENLPKQYLYHRVPEKVAPDKEGKQILYPLKMLKTELEEELPGTLYEIHEKKYHDDGREGGYVPDKIIPTLDVTWGDVVNLTPVHPEEVLKALRDAGFKKPKTWKYYQIDPELLKSENTTVFLFRDDIVDEHPDNFKTYDSKNLTEYTAVPEKTKEYYQKKFHQDEFPFLFMQIPHVFHKGPIPYDVSNFPVISVSLDKEGKIICENEK